MRVFGIRLGSEALIVQHFMKLQYQGVELRGATFNRGLGCQSHQAFSLFPLHGWASEILRGLHLP